MQKAKYDFSKRRELLNCPALTPKVTAKKHIGIRRKGLAVQQSAHERNRNPERSLLLSQQECSSVPEEAVRNSSMFRLLLDEMSSMAAQHSAEVWKLKEVKQERGRQLRGVRQQQYSAKMEIWELKNQVLELRETIKEEREECLRLSNELWIQDSEQLSASG